MRESPAECGRVGNYAVLDPSIQERLNGRSLIIEYRETERKKSPLVTKRVRFTSTKGRNAFAKSYDHEMAAIHDSEFDSYFAKYGTIIDKFTSTIREGTLTGQRTLKLDLLREIPRKVEIAFAKTSDGDVVFEMKDIAHKMSDSDSFRAKGNRLVYYKGQNYICGRCSRMEKKQISHNNKCPLLIEDEKKKEEKKKLHEENVEALLIGTSNLRCLDSLNTKAKTLASSGARIGHTATQINHQATENYNTLIIQTGDNNYEPDININARSDENAYYIAKGIANQYVTQQDKELKALEDAVLNGRRIYPFNKVLQIYGGGVPPPFDTLKKFPFLMI